MDMQATLLGKIDKEYFDFSKIDFQEHFLYEVSQAEI